MENTLARKFAAGSGILLVVSLVASAAVAGSPPMADDSVGKIASFYADHRDRILVSNYIGGFAIIFLLVFAGALRNFLRSAEGDLPGPTSVILVSGAATAATAVAGGAFALVLAYRLPDNPALVQSFYDANLLVFSFISFPIAALIGGTSAAVVRTGALPRAVAMVGGVVILIQLVSAASFAKSGAFMPGGPIGFVAFITFLIWVLVVSVVLLAGKRPGTAATA
jgi:hypothetical protein